MLQNRNKNRKSKVVLLRSRGCSESSVTVLVLVQFMQRSFSIPRVVSYTRTLREDITLAYFVFFGRLAVNFVLKCGLF